MVLTLAPTSLRLCFPNTIENSKSKAQTPSNVVPLSLFHLKPHGKGRKRAVLISALPETAASVIVSAVVVGVAATLLTRNNKDSKKLEIPLEICEDCGGSGICSECKGEGFVLKKLSEESAVRARLAAKNMATRYTAGLPKKWTYCSKCSSARSCNNCGGRGTVSS